MSTTPQTAKEPRRAKPSPTIPAADPPGEMPEDLREAGWVLREHVNDAGDYKLFNKRSKKATGAYATPQLCFEAARRITEQEAKHAPKEVNEAAPIGRYAVTTRSPRLLKTRLTGDELLARLDAWGDLRAKKAEIEAEAKEVADGYKAQVDKLKAELAPVEKALQTHAEEREVECEERLYDDAKLVCVVRLDTEEVVEQRPMRPEEMQRPLPKL